MLLMLSFSHKQFENPIKWKVMAQIWIGCLKIWQYEGHEGMEGSGLHGP